MKTLYPSNLSYFSLFSIKAVDKLLKTVDNLYKLWKTRSNFLITFSKNARFIHSKSTHEPFSDRFIVWKIYPLYLSYKIKIYPQQTVDKNYSFYPHITGYIMNSPPDLGFYVTKNYLIHLSPAPTTTTNLIFIQYI